MVSCLGCGLSASQWVCGCGCAQWRAVTVGSARTAEELSQAFPTTTVIRSDSSSRVDRVPPEPVVVISTPGCEPDVDSGYAAAVVLDAQGFLSRPDLKASEEAVRRWLDVVHRVRSGQDGGTVLIVGPSQDRAVQAVARLDPVGFARRELADRVEAGFPPATRMAVFSGAQEMVDAVARELSQAGYVAVLGPICEEEAGESRLVARVDSSRGEEFAALLAGMAARRSQTSRRAALSWRLDPEWLGG